MKVDKNITIGKKIDKVEIISQEYICHANNERDKQISNRINLAIKNAKKENYILVETLTNVFSNSMTVTLLFSEKDS